jgi:hypothetical protein
MASFQPKDNMFNNQCTACKGFAILKQVNTETNRKKSDTLEKKAENR